MSAQRVYINSSEFQPKNEYILVKPIDLKSEETTQSGLIIQIKNNSVLDRPTMGEVISTGNDITDISEGMIVFWPLTDGIDFEFDDGNFMLLRYVSIIGSKKVEQI